MDQESIIGIIELTSIIAAGGLGIASAVTDTKDEKGRLTRWGMIAVGGIIITNSFSFIQSFLQQKKEANEQLALYERERVRDSISRVEYQEQVNLLYANIYKSDSSLKQQLQIQTATTDVLAQVDKSISVQDRIFKQSELVVQQQYTAVDKIDRTLNPLFPFKVDLTLLIRADSAAVDMMLNTDMLNLKLANDTDVELEKKGLAKFKGKKGTALLINPGSLDYEGFVNVLVRQQLTLTFSRAVKGGQGKLVCEPPEGYFHNRSNMQNITIIFNRDDKSYFIVLRDVPMRVISGSGFNSTIDLEGGNFELALREAPGYISSLQVDFKFPPDFSRINRLKNNGRAYNLIPASTDPYTYIYSTNNVIFTYY